MPRLSDDGRTVTLDLHGARVDEALRMARRALSLAEQRGRARLDVVHGGSTTDGMTRTIKSELYDWLDGRQAPRSVRSEQRAYAVLSLHLDLTARAQSARLNLRDVMQ